MRTYAALAMLACGLAFAFDSRVEAKEPDASSEAPIRAAADAFVAAFDKGDAQGVASLWVENGTLAEEGGEVLKGREAIAGRYAEFFEAYPGSTLKVDVTSIHFVTPEM